MTELTVAVIETHGEQDTVVLAQLGAAVVLAWPQLDADMRRDLIATAAILDGIEKHPKFEAIMNRLVHVNDRSNR